ncbi:uncharacterized protein LOC107620566 [Arachis ipaensis]|uniref:uncharacterized protein LOC107620566 n=1 Tax=Arachis ipaensis TaxID=130454 RepID=UPI0007AF65BD|nr:uncharacterized protein LOC107620566 [Arachis ipaensis]
MDLYDGTSNPSHHLNNFKSRMYLVDASDATRCKDFSTNLTKAAIKWFDNLPPKSITSFDDLARKTLIDQGISADILFKPAFDKLGLEEKDLKTYPDSLFGLGDTPIQPLGYISLYTTFGKAVVSTPHLYMKFSTAEGIATVKRDQKLARKCYNESLNLKGNSGRKEVNTIELGGVRTREELRPNLRKASDMPGINPDLMSHKLAVYPSSQPVQQKRRKLGTERTQVIEEQIQVLLEAGFIREVKDPLWLANVVLVKKQNGKYKMCVDYIDLNKACPKDPYPFPSINAMVDLASGYRYLSFMDAYSGYNQISMYKPDQKKTSFITPKANYCYIVMPFGLKNAGATYQQLMNKVFSAHIEKFMEVYVDDMLVKTKEDAGKLGG